MNRIIATLASLLILSSTAGPLHAQTSFQRTVGEPGSAAADFAFWMEQTADGGWIVLGAPESVAFPGFAEHASRLMKLDSGGAVDWVRDYASCESGISPGIGGVDVAAALAPINMGGHAFTGSGVDALGNSDREMLVRTDEGGAPIWSWRFPTSSPPVFYLGPTLAEMPFAGAGFAMAGSSFQNPALRRIGMNGALLFARRFTNGSVPTVESRGCFNDVHLLPNGLVAVGWLRVPIGFGFYNEQSLVVRFDLAGNVLWARTYRQVQHNAAWGVEVAANGDFLVAGFSKDAAEGGGTYLMRITASGTLLWHQWFVGFQGTRSVRELPSGDILLAGSAVLAPFTWLWQAAALRTTAAGILAECRTYGQAPDPGFPPDYGICAFPTVDGGFALLGETDTFGAAIGRQCYLVKADTSAPILGFSGCNEGDFLPDVLPGACVPTIEELIPEPEDPRETCVEAVEHDLSAPLLCMECEENDPCPSGALEIDEAASSPPGGPCDSPPTTAIPLSCGTTYCGEFHWDTVTASVRDTDWFVFTPLFFRKYAVTVHADVDVDVFILTANCGGATFVATGSGTCPTVAVAECLSEIPHWVFVAPKFTNPPITLGSTESKYTITFSCASGCPPISCLGDLDGDGTVTGGDLGALLANWGASGTGLSGDLDGNGTIDGGDLGFLLGAWGDCPQEPDPPQPLAYEPFDCPAGTLVSACSSPGALGWLGNWSGGWDLAAPGLGYTDAFGNELAVSGNRVQDATANSFRTIELPGAPLGDEDGTLWISMLAHQLSTSPVGSWMGLSLPSTTGADDYFFVGKAYQKAHWSIDNGVFPQILESMVPTTEDAFIVVRIEFDADGDEDIWIWIDPDDIAAEPTEETADIVAPNFGDFAGITQVRINIGTNADPILGTIDEIRLGTSYGAVAPVGGP